ncbi:MAG: hypothetical protein DRP85_08610 [Candidatus Makaraimicrobium thalassicum]|nr:MAG: hypothetical protein DRP85_08610 [Candidatus Omnitrophota bacterium]
MTERKRKNIMQMFNCKYLGGAWILEVNRKGCRTDSKDEGVHWLRFNFNLTKMGFNATTIDCTAQHETKD